MTKFYGDIAGESGLPPPDVWLIDPSKDKFDTPVDNMGFIDVPMLIQAVKDTVSPDYEWPDRLSVHHLYWKDEWYSSRFIGMDAQKFRNLSIHKALLPRVFENWLHEVTIPPDIPDPLLMQQRIEGWAQARNLFVSAREYIRWERRAKRREDFIKQNPDVLPSGFNGEDVIGKEFLAHQLGRHFTGFEIHMDLFRQLPEEHRLVEAGSSPQELAHKLGKFVVPSTLKLISAVAA